MHTHKSHFVIADAVVMSAIVLVSLALAHSTFVAQHPELMGTAIVVDLTLTLALGHWFLGVKKARLPAWTVLPVIVVGYALSSLALPQTLQPSKDFVFVLGALVELSFGPRRR